MLIPRKHPVRVSDILSGRRVASKSCLFAGLVAEFVLWHVSLSRLTETIQPESIAAHESDGKA